MSAAATMTIDAGTGSCRAVLFGADGDQLGIGQREWTHRPEPGVRGSQVFDTAMNWRLVCECIRDALTRANLAPDDVAAVSATSMREGMVLWDGAGNELWACPNVDARAGEQAARLVRSGDAQRIYERAGDWVAITAPARFLWLAEHEPETLARTEAVGMLADWVIARLSGTHVTDPSIGSSSGMFDLARRDWSPDVLEICGLPAGIFPPVRDPGSVAGAVSEVAADQTGLVAGTPVVVGGADTQLGLVGIGRLDSGVTIVGGTFWQTTVVTDAPLIDPQGRLRTLCHAVPGAWMTEGIGFYSGLAMRWFRDAFGEPARRAAADGGDHYALLEQAASELPPGAGGVVALLSNVMEARRWVHAAPSFLGLDLNEPQSAVGACVRAIEEAAAYVASAHLAIIVELTGATPDEVVFTGGAAKGTLWPQIVADVLGLPLRVPAVTESTALGGAVYARLGAGLDDDIGAVLQRIVRFDRRYEPDEQSHARYGELSGTWHEIYQDVLALSDGRLLQPLWRAAGT
jgi:autoinducer 2 (AI-2) kinase